MDNWIIIKNQNDMPKKDKYILFLGKSGKFGSGYTEERKVNLCGGGFSGIQLYEDIYAYAYLDPPIDLIKNMYNNLSTLGKASFSRTMLNKYFTENNISLGN